MGSYYVVDLMGLRLPQLERLENWNKSLTPGGNPVMLRISLVAPTLLTENHRAVPGRLGGPRCIALIPLNLPHGPVDLTLLH